MHPITRTRPLVSAEFILAQKTDRVLWNQPARIGLRLRKSNGFWTCQRSGASRLRGGFGGGLPREPGQGGLGTAKISSREIPAQGPQGGCGRTRPPPARAAGRFGPGSVQRPTHTLLYVGPLIPAWPLSDTCFFQMELASLSEAMSPQPLSPRLKLGLDHGETAAPACCGLRHSSWARKPVLSGLDPRLVFLIMPWHCLYTSRSSPTLANHATALPSMSSMWSDGATSFDSDQAARNWCRVVYCLIKRTTPRPLVQVTVECHSTSSRR